MGIYQGHNQRKCCYLDHKLIWVGSPSNLRFLIIIKKANQGLLKSSSPKWNASMITISHKLPYVLYEYALHWYLD